MAWSAARDVRQWELVGVVGGAAGCVLGEKITTRAGAVQRLFIKKLLPAMALESEWGRWWPAP